MVCDVDQRQAKTRKLQTYFAGGGIEFFSTLICRLTRLVKNMHHVNMISIDVIKVPLPNTEDLNIG